MRSGSESSPTSEAAVHGFGRERSLTVEHTDGAGFTVTGCPCRTP